MRIRPLVALSLAALTALALAGCGSAAPDGSPSSSASAVADGDLCAAAAPSGAEVEAITVEGTVGESVTVDFTAPLEVTELQRAVAVEGDGAAIADGDYVTYELTVVDGSTGETAQEATQATGSVLVGAGIDQFFGCATEGSRIVTTLPAADASGVPYVYVIDVLEVLPADEWCAVTEPGADFPTVEFSGEGVPTVTVPQADPPAGVQLEVLETGDGEIVESGDNVTVNYTGVKWSDGSVFDSSWDRGEPATFATTGVVAGFQRALEGQTVGSTVLVSMAPACGYGEAGSSAHELAGETLVFVVDIIETARP